MTLVHSLDFMEPFPHHGALPDYILDMKHTSCNIFQGQNLFISVSLCGAALVIRCTPLWPSTSWT